MRFVIATLFVSALNIAATAQLHTISLGASVIEPKVSAEYELSPNTAARLDMGFYIGATSNVSINPAIHFHKANNAMNIGDNGMLVPYHGPGLMLQFGSENNSIGLDFVWGLEYDAFEIPFKIFADAGPYLIVQPETVVSLTGSIGMRYTFK